MRRESPKEKKKMESIGEMIRFCQLNEIKLIKKLSGLGLDTTH